MSNQWGILDVFKKDFKEDPDVIKKNNIINKPKQEHKSSDKTKFKTNLGFDYLTYVLLLINIYNASQGVIGQSRTAVFPWSPNFQFILDITSDSKVFQLITMNFGYQKNDT